jgi:hypothetical protein
LAGEPAAEDVDRWHSHRCTSVPRFGLLRLPCFAPLSFQSRAFGVGHKGAHVGMARDSWPVPGKDPSAELVLLALPHNAHAGSFEAEVEPADPGEEASDGEHVTTPGGF